MLSRRQTAATHWERRGSPRLPFLLNDRTTTGVT